MMNKKGQTTIANLPYALVTLILVAVLYSPFVDIVVTPNENVTGATGLIINLLPLFWWLGGLFILLYVMIPTRQNG